MSLFRRGGCCFARARAWILVGASELLCAGAAFSQTLSTSSAEQRIEAIQASIRARDFAAAGGLLSAFNMEPAPSARAWIVDAVGALAPAKGLALFEKALSDRDAEVRGAAVQALGALGGPRAAADIAAALAAEKNPGLRHAMAFWLGTFKDDASVEALDKALGSDPVASVRLQAAHSLKWIGTENAKRRLKKAASDPDARVRGLGHE